MFRETRAKLYAIYVVLPLVIMSFVIYGFYLVNENPRTHNQRKPLTLGIPEAGLIAPSTKRDHHYDAYLGAKAALDFYNDFYAESSSSLDIPITIKKAVGSSATHSRLRSYLSTTDRVHISSHGELTNTGPNVDMYGADLNPRVVDYWSHVNGECELVFISACNSLGPGNGIVDTRLAEGIKDKTNVRMVIGYTGEVALDAAAFLAINFWYEHTAGLRIPYHDTPTGGYDGATAFSRARYLLEEYLEDIRDGTNIAVGTAVGLIAGLWFSSLETMAADFFAELFAEVWGLSLADYIFKDYMEAWESAHDSFLCISDGEYVSSMTPVSTGGGKDYVITPY
ncbi:MAG: hypothetical protein GF309_11065 [Candidatus Lokiarchaeota archaeon]|nr:hypothetical protein [Candidatus Lokiarchaeota archaeon]